MRRGVLAVLLASSCCAPRSAPAPPAAPPNRWLLSDAMAATDLLCVRLEAPYRNRVSCMPVGAVRQLIRGRLLAALRVQP